MKGVIHVLTFPVLIVGVIAGIIIHTFLLGYHVAGDWLASVWHDDSGDPRHPRMEEQ